MDTKAYIESGIIESYVLGLADPAAAAEFEKFYAQYPEIHQAVKEFSALLEKHALTNAIAPPAHIKEKLSSILGFQTDKLQNSEAPVVSLPTAAETGSNVFPLRKYFLAACIILLIISSGSNIYLYNRYHAENIKYQALLTQSNSLQVNNNIYRTRVSSLQEALRIIENPDMLVVPLKAVEGKENNAAIVYWNNKTKDVYLSSSNLPEAPNGKQFQLWAIVNGKPVNAGLIDNCDNLCKLKNIPSAEAFAITLEESGGSAAPTLSQMVVIGKV